MVRPNYEHSATAAKLLAPPSGPTVPTAYFDAVLRELSALRLQVSRIEDHAQEQLVSKAWIKRAINKPRMSDGAFHAMMSRHRIRSRGHRGYPRHLVEKRLLKATR